MSNKDFLYEGLEDNLQAMSSRQLDIFETRLLKMLEDYDKLIDILLEGGDEKLP